MISGEKRLIEVAKVMPIKDYRAIHEYKGCAHEAEMSRYWAAVAPLADDL
jgi:hypothetical protein